MFIIKGKKWKFTLPSIFLLLKREITIASYMFILLYLRIQVQPFLAFSLETGGVRSVAVG